MTGSLAVGAGTHGFNCQDPSAVVDVDPGGEITVAGTAVQVRSWNAPLEVDGRLQVDGSTLNLNSAGPNTHDGELEIDAAGGVTLQSNQAFAGTARVGGAGTLGVTAGASTLAGGVTLDPATLNLANGSLSLDGTAPATTLPLVQFTGGTFTGTRDRAVTTLNAQSGTLTGDHTTTAAALAKSTPGQFAVTGGATLDSTGDATWSDGPLCLQSGGTLRIRDSLTAAAGTHGFNCQDSSALVDIAAGSSVDLGDGDRSWNAPVTNAGLFTLTSGDRVLFNSGLANVAGGVLTGTGTAGSAVNNSGGTVRPGTSPGVLTVDGTFTQGAGGTLEVEVDGAAAGTGFDRLAVTGTANLGGTLAILRDPGFEPDAGDTFQVVTSGSRTGTFATVTGTAIATGKDFEARYPAAAPFGAQLVVTGEDEPTAGVPVIEGTMAVGSTITCNEGTWTGDPDFTYAWLRDGTPIPGATARTYPIVAADAARQLTCRVTGTNTAGSAVATSAARSVPAVGPASSSPPAISGTPATGQTLTCDPGTFTGAPAPTLAFEWLRDGTPIAGATGSTYTLTGDDAGHAITCRVTATNPGGSAAATSPAVTPPAPTPTATPTPAATATPTPTPAPSKKPDPPLENATPQQVAAAFGLPPARKCVSRRNFVIRLREPKGIKIRKARVLVNGKAAKVRKVKGRFIARVDLRGLPKGRFTVAIRVTTRDKRKLRGSRRYKTCAKKQTAKRNRPSGGGGT